jgi:two-component system response regulator (stage 0 sporulation protein F)
MSEKIKLLYVDDEPINLYIFEIYFRKKYEVITGTSGFEGLAQLKAHRDIRIVISDMNMPGMNGLEFVRMAKEEFSDIAFYILTGYDITEEIKNALDKRLIDKYFRKPLNAKEIELSFSDVKVNY